MLPPVEIDGRRYIDGAVTDNAAISAAAAAGADRCLVFDLGAATSCGPLGTSVLQVVLQAIHITSRQRLEAELACPPPGIEIHHLPLPCDRQVPLADFTQGARLVAEGYRQAQALLGKEHGRPAPDVASPRAAKRDLGAQDQEAIR